MKKTDSPLHTLESVEEMIISFGKSLERYLQHLMQIQLHMHPHPFSTKKHKILIIR